MTRTRWLAVAAIGCVALAYWTYGSVVAACAWQLTLVAGCVGYGTVVCHVSRTPASIAVQACIGLGVLVAVSTPLARIGVLTRDVQLVLVGLGVIACTARLDSAALHRDVALTGKTAAAMLALVVVAVVGQADLISDGANHTLLVKQLWDRGATAIFHQFGGHVVGESYGALFSGAYTAALFEQGLCPALLVWILSSELGRRDEHARYLLAALAVPIALFPAPTRWEVGFWPAATVVVAMFVVGQRAQEAGRRGWAVLPLAAMLGCLRHEYVVFALPYAATSLLIPGVPVRGRTLAGAAIFWALGMFAMQLAYRTSPGIAALRSVALVGVWPVAAAMLRPLGAVAPGAPLAIHAAALLAYTTACLTHAISVSFQDTASLPAVWYASALCVVIALPAVRAVFAAIVVAIVVGWMTLDVNLDYAKRERVRTRLSEPAARAGEIMQFGLRTEGHEDMRALQELVPPGESIAFWGLSAGLLDFERNPITDVSWPAERWRTEFYLTPVQPRALRGSTYLLVETMFGRIKLDPWGDWRPTALDSLDGSVELVGTNGRARLYRIAVP